MLPTVYCTVLFLGLASTVAYRSQVYGHIPTDNNVDDDGEKTMLVFREEHKIQGAYTKCEVGTVKKHPYKCDRYIVCNLSGAFHTVLCLEQAGYDPTLGFCTRSYPCHRDVIARVRRAVDDADDGSGDISTDYTNNLGLDDNSTAEILDNSADTNKTVIPDNAVTSLSVANDTSQLTTESIRVVAMDTNITAPENVTVPTVTNTTTVPMTTSTVQATSSKAAVDLTTLEVLIPEKSEEPPYVVITHPPEPEITTAKNVTDAVEEIQKSSMGAIIGIVVALIAIIVIVTVVVILVKKKKLKLSSKIPVKRKKKIVTRMENPQYRDGKGAATYRFSRDSKLEVGPTSVTLTKFNNPNLGDTPIPKVLQTESTGPKRSGSLPRSIASRREKRKAPAPPNPFGDGNEDLEADLYEKASQGSGDVELQTFAVKNENADANDNDQSYPLLKRNTNGNDKTAMKESNGNVKNDDGGESSPEPEGSDKSEKASLLPKEKSKSSASLDPDTVDPTLDEYDMTKNPFFADK